MNHPNDECGLCHQKAECHVLQPSGIVKVKCDRCGEFDASEEVHSEINIKLHHEYLVSGCTREATERGDRITVARENYESLVDSAPTRIADKAVKLLAAIERRTPHFGTPIVVESEKDYPLAYAANPREFSALLEFIQDRQFIRFRGARHAYEVELLADGVQELERRQRSNLASEKAFVAMWFSGEMKPVYDKLIAPAIEDAGYDPVRIDTVEFNGDIIDRMLAEIRESRFVVSDFTGHREGVYFEAGFAMGLGLPVIMICRDDAMGEAHFDTEHFNHIVWQADNDALRERLCNRILATIGRGPLKTPVR